MVKDRSQDAVQFSYAGDLQWQELNILHPRPIKDAADIVPDTIEPDPVPAESRQSPKLYVPPPNEMARLAGARAEECTDRFLDFANFIILWRSDIF